MSDVVIRVENLYKEYRLGTISHGTLHKDLQSWWARIRGKEDPNSIIALHDRLPERGPSAENPHILALNDVSFDVQRGEVLGIIGRNGAGKSTLLKILSEVTAPTKGTVKMKGRVASLLEVGTGFHPELTGRENIYLNGAILGMTKREIARKLDEIVDFAEIEKFIDTPVKRYSSGMYVRLAFAVAAHLEPEILIVDEVLAVGDAQFQKKCLGKMGDVARGGRTILFVSHNMGAIHTLTRKCIYLENGRITYSGNTDTAINAYLSADVPIRSDGTYNLDLFRPDYVLESAASERTVSISHIWIEAKEGKTDVVPMGESFSVYVEIDIAMKLENANITIILLNSDGQVISTFFSWDKAFYITLGEGKHIIRLDILDLDLPPGRYHINAGINQSTDTIAWDVIYNLPLFEIRNTGKIIQWLNRPWGAIYWNQHAWSMQS
jgi:lipopolysaccharide transport system ATP-binding protein